MASWMAAPPCLRAMKPFNPVQLRTFASTICCQKQASKRRRNSQVAAQARARKAANTSRQTELEKQRKEALGNPVKGIPTPFVESFDTATSTNDASNLNFFLSPAELETVQTSQPQDEADAAKLEEENATADEALRRITSLSLSSSQDRLRVNIQRCIETFGRHNTDKILPPSPSNPPKPGKTVVEQHQLENNGKMPRVGPDTGSSEVQIGILTAKIRALYQYLETRGGPDKMNKRNLRLLVHRRQKLLKYLRKKDKGGARWQRVIGTLGLTEGTWKGEISF
ncbi:S15/NS1 RNA-binding domain-containing protein [Piedraia hortae CBS 480.64]|uniref:S15/NS1 RNA-binding domain-containing protein n=1 Tax=Piedraia hortae CBS 480.64 TaxID=1314780 RepID=A0A6A7C2G7_9PEZI|nr:S15/NS1 RNA-binding domain-containing protein [Piedraia hortae CBS 480.64]